MQFVSCSAKSKPSPVFIAGAISVAVAFLLVFGVAVASGQSSEANGAPAQSGQQTSHAAQGQPSSQTSAQAPQQPSAPDARRAEADQELKKEEQQRMLAVVPDILSVRNGHAVPLSPAQKFRLALADIFDPFDFAASAADAGLEQEQGEFPGYGTGWTGYGKRFGAAYADDADGEMMTDFLLPTLLHQDPRYFRLGQGGVRRRLVYTLLSAVRCRGDNGDWQVNASGIAGTFAAGAISNAYYPPADRGFGLTLQRGSIDWGEGLLQSLASEFYPDISRALFHRHPKGTQSPYTVSDH